VSARVLNDIPRSSWRAAIEAARAVFVPGNRFGVHAFAIGPRIRHGRRRKTLALNVYVKRKLLQPRFPVPNVTFAVGRASWQLVPNVIGTSKRARAATGGAPHYSGLHPGAVVTVRGSTPGRGALTCLLTTGGDPTHALTAGHVFPAGALGASIFAAASPTAQVRAVGKVVANFLDDSTADGAVIELNSAGVALVTSTGPQLSDFLPERSVWGKLTRAFLATANDFTREVETEAQPGEAHLWAPTRGVFSVQNAIQTDGEITFDGDSGTVLCTGTTNAIAVGVCSGGTGAHSVFEPFSRIIGLAQQQVNGNLAIF
jgi:hypothetical protein